MNLRLSRIFWLARQVVHSYLNLIEILFCAVEKIASMLFTFFLFNSSAWKFIQKRRLKLHPEPKKIPSRNQHGHFQTFFSSSLANTFGPMKYSRIIGSHRCPRAFVYDSNLGALGSYPKKSITALFFTVYLIVIFCVWIVKRKVENNRKRGRYFGLFKKYFKMLPNE